MFNRRLLQAAAAMAAAVLAACGGGSNNSLPAPKMPQSWTVQAGGSAQNEALQALQFYPSTITIDAGDSITWTYPAGEPHTVTFLGPKSSPPPPNDPSVSAPAGGATYDGSTYTSSGFILGGGKYTLTFPKAGTYTYYCLIHGEMVGTVIVQSAGAKYPHDITEIVNGVPSAVAADLKTATDALAAFPYTAGGPHLAAGLSAGLGAGAPNAASVVRFLDGDQLSDTSVTIKAGSTLTWTNLDNNLPHTVTIAPAGQTFPAMNPFSPPLGGTTYDGTQLVNSGPLFGGQSFSLTFTTPGTYTYHCLFHDETENMIGTVVVQ
jgi:plastocyanin